MKSEITKADLLTLFILLKSESEIGELPDLVRKYDFVKSNIQGIIDNIARAEQSDV